MKSDVHAFTTSICTLELTITSSQDSKKKSFCDRKVGDWGGIRTHTHVMKNLHLHTRKWMCTSHALLSLRHDPNLKNLINLLIYSYIYQVLRTHEKWLMYFKSRKSFKEENLVTLSLRLLYESSFNVLLTTILIGSLSYIKLSQLGKILVEILFMKCSGRVVQNYEFYFFIWYRCQHDPLVHNATSYCLQSLQLLETLFVESVYVFVRF